MQRLMTCLILLCSVCTIPNSFAQQPGPQKKSHVIDLGFDEEQPPSINSTGKHTHTTFSHVELSWQGAYEPAPHDLIARVESKGLDASAIKTLDDPETPNAVRIMILDAASHDGRAASAAKKLMRAWSGGSIDRERMSVDRLSAEQLLMLGYLAARASPRKLEPLGGDTEVEKLSPVTLLMAATSRRRGDLTSRVVLAQIKAQAAVEAPDDALCMPYQCMVTAVQPFFDAWSVHPDVICRFALSGDTTGRGLDPDDPLAFCGEDPERVKPPLFVEQARQEEQERKAAMSSAPPSSSSPGGSGSRALQQELAMIDMAIAQLKQERARMSGIEGVLVEQMILELERQRQFIEANLNGASSPSPVTTPAPGSTSSDPFGIGKQITF